MSSSAGQILELLGPRALAVSGNHDQSVAGVAALGSSRQQDCLTFCSIEGPRSDALVAEASAAVILRRQSEGGALPHPSACVISVEHPRLEFLRVVSELLDLGDPDQDAGEPTVDSTARLGSGVVLGPGVTVGPGTTIHANVVINARSSVGARVTIHPNTTIGADGFGYERDPLTGQALKFPHVARVVIEDDVEIGANTCIDRGSLTDTVIRRGAKIDNLVHIAHNVEICEDAFVIAHAMVAGSVRVGARAWIAPSAVLLNGIRIGEDATVGLGSVVTGNVVDGAIVAGSPARPLDDFRALMRAQRRDIENLRDRDEP